MAHSLASSIPKAAIQAKVHSFHGKVSPGNHVPGEKVYLPNNSRRVLLCGLVGVGLSASMSNGDAIAAGRRPPPPPPEEKKDPNMTALQAKILANRKRKEAMKESIAKLREKGKPTN